MTKEEAIEVYNGLLNQKIKEAFEFFVPELRESEDERIRKDIIYLIHWLKANPSLCSQYYKDRYDSILAWLEKQKTSEEAIRYVKENHSPDEVSDFQSAMNIAVAKAYDKGVQDTLEKQKEEEGYEAVPVESTLEYKLGFKAGKESEKQKDPENVSASTMIPSCWAEEPSLQKERKPTDEDERILGEIIVEIREQIEDSTKAPNVADLDDIQRLHQLRRWESYLKKLYEQKPAEWSEEDEKIAKEIEEELLYPGDFPDYPSKEESELYDDCQRRLNWFKNKLKSLRSQPMNTIKIDELEDFIDTELHKDEFIRRWPQYAFNVPEHKEGDEYSIGVAVGVGRVINKLRNFIVNKKA